MNNSKKSECTGKNNKPGKFSFLIFQLFQFVISILISSDTAAVTRSSRISGNWDNPSCWTPAGVPDSGDDVFIANGNTITLNGNGQVRSLTVSQTSFFTALNSKSLVITGNLTVNGTVDMNGGNILLQNYGSAFVLGPEAAFTWSPGNNTSAGATLFTNGIENFNPTSTLIIDKWYDYTVPLGSVVTGNFGNLMISTFDGTSSIIEWNQKNNFQNHRITGTLTIDQGWITLDKTGAISNTEIGQIVLTSVNSTFIAHNGTHPSSFSLGVNSIINNGGKFYGLNDGNGNVNIHVSGNFYNSGNVKIINNSGVSGVANGNATFFVDGDYIQTTGDTRIIYNVTTTGSGIFDASFRNLSLNGGIFMGQSGCHTQGYTNNLAVMENFTIYFNNASDKFRGNGISSIGQTLNNAKLNLVVGRNLNINGNENAEFTSSASSGTERIQVNGDLAISGCKVNFNYGTLAASHASEIFIAGTLLSKGGAVFLSKNAGSLNVLVEKGIQMQSGTLAIKGNSGAATLNIQGPFYQSGGILQLHSNHSNASNDVIRINANGSFRQSSGSIIYDNNASGKQHIISVRGDSCILEGNGILYRDGSGSTSVYGIFSFDKQGKIWYERRGSSHFVEQVVEHINNGCEVVAANTSMKLSSNTSQGLISLKILSGGKLSLNNTSISSNGVYGYCKIEVDSLGILSFSNEDGFYGKLNSAIRQGVGYYLHRKSIVEYRGSKTQWISGSPGSSPTDDVKYGILRINLSGSGYRASMEENINVRTRLELIQGKLHLNNHTLFIENGGMDAIFRKKGYIESDPQNITSLNRLTWKNITKGVHEFPFGLSNESYLPVKMDIHSGNGGTVSMNTYAIPNESFATNSLLPPTGNTLSGGELAVKRRWEIEAEGISADIILTFDKNESPNGKEFNFYSMASWNGSNWENITATSNDTYGSNARTVGSRNLTNWSNFALLADTVSQALRIRFIDAKSLSREVELIWESVAEETSGTYTIEKSTDGVNYFAIGEKESIGRNSTSEYRFSDLNPGEGTTYYRIKTSGPLTGTIYSETKTVNKFNGENSNGISIHSVYPNPFSDVLEINYSTTESATIQITDAQGKIVFTKNTGESGTNKKETFNDLGYLNKGIYFLSVISGGKNSSIKLIKN